MDRQSPKDFTPTNAKDKPSSPDQAPSPPLTRAPEQSSSDTNPKLQQETLFPNSKYSLLPHVQEAIEAIPDTTKITYLGQGGEGPSFHLKMKDGSDEVIKLIQLSAIQLNLSEDSITKEDYILSRLSHPRFVRLIRSVPVFCPGYGAQYREYASGDSVKEKLAAEGSMPAEKVLDIALQVLEGLAHLHDPKEHGLPNEGPIIHRDLKPSNLIIDESNYVRIIDFGAAKLDEGTVGYTMSLRGTPDYCPPEQFELKAYPSSDIYSLGVTMVEMLIGELPSLTKQSIQRGQGVRFPYEVDVPPKLKKILDKMVRLDAAERYQSAKELIRDLRSGEVLVGAGAVPERVGFWRRVVGYLIPHLRQFRDLMGRIEKIALMEGEGDLLATIAEAKQCGLDYGVKIPGDKLERWKRLYEACFHLALKAFNSKADSQNFLTKECSDHPPQSLYEDLSTLRSRLYSNPCVVSEKLHEEFSDSCRNLGRKCRRALETMAQLGTGGYPLDDILNLYNSCTRQVPELLDIDFLASVRTDFYKNSSRASSDKSEWTRTSNQFITDTLNLEKLLSKLHQASSNRETFLEVLGDVSEAAKVQNSQPVGQKIELELTKLQEKIAEAEKEINLLSAEVYKKQEAILKNIYFLTGCLKYPALKLELRLSDAHYGENTSSLLFKVTLSSSAFSFAHDLYTFLAIAYFAQSSAWKDLLNANRIELENFSNSSKIANKIVSLGGMNFYSENSSLNFSEQLFRFANFLVQEQERLSQNSSETKFDSSPGTIVWNERVTPVSSKQASQRWKESPTLSLLAQGDVLAKCSSCIEDSRTGDVDPLVTVFRIN